MLRLLKTLWIALLATAAMATSCIRIDAEAPNPRPHTGTFPLATSLPASADTPSSPDNRPLP